MLGNVSKVLHQPTRVEAHCEGSTPNLTRFSNNYSGGIVYSSRTLMYFTFYITLHLPTFQPEILYFFTHLLSLAPVVDTAGSQAKMIQFLVITLLFGVFDFTVFLVFIYTLII